MYENEKYDIEWTLPYMDNYTGPGWSNGKWQSSVANGDKKPKSRSDSYSRDHDTSYKLCNDDSCLDDADWLYYKRFQTFDHPVPKYLIGPAPLLYNIPVRAVSRFFSGEKYSKMSQAIPPPSLRGSRDSRTYQPYETGAVVNDTFLRGSRKVDPLSSDVRQHSVSDINSSARPVVYYDPNTDNFNTKSPVMGTNGPSPLSVPENKEAPPFLGGNSRGLWFRSKMYNPKGYTGFHRLFKDKKKYKNRVYLDL